MKNTRLFRLILLVGGLFNLVVGVALIIVPHWFSDTVANFGAYNQHFIGDAGSFLIGVALAMLVSSRDPQRYRAVIGVVAVSHWLHLANHVYDDVQSGNMTHVVTLTLPILFLTLLLTWIWYALRSKNIQAA